MFQCGPKDQLRGMLQWNPASGGGIGKSFAGQIQRGSGLDSELWILDTISVPPITSELMQSFVARKSECLWLRLSDMLRHYDMVASHSPPRGL